MSKDNRFSLFRPSAAVELAKSLLEGPPVISSLLGSAPDAPKPAESAENGGDVPPKQEATTLDGTKYDRAEDVPAAFRDGGKPDGEILTPDVLSDPKWRLSGPYLAKNYGPGKTLTTRVKIGRKYAYLFTEVSVLFKIKDENDAKQGR